MSSKIAGNIVITHLFVLKSFVKNEVIFKKSFINKVYKYIFSSGDKCNNKLAE